MTHGTPDGRQESSVNFTIAFSTGVHQAQSNTVSAPRYRQGRSGPKFLKSPDIPNITLLDFTSLSHHLLFQTLTSALPACFGECWLCPSQVKLMTTICALDHLTRVISPLVHCSESNITNSPYFSHVSLLGITDCFNSSGTHVVSTLDSAD